LFDSAGNLYGTTYTGGAGGGIVFSLTPTSTGPWTENILHTFSNGDGLNPAAGLVFDAHGNLCGTTSAGGSGAQGTVFELTPDVGGAWTETILHNFQNGTDGSEPKAALVFDTAGNLFGTTQAGGGGVNCGPQVGGCGTVFQLTPSGTGTWTESVLTSFTTQAGSGYPLSTLIFDGVGNLYGTTSINGNGPTASGEVFEITP